MAQIVERHGNIFTTGADVLTVTVNCEGVMGAGIALEARYRWPRMFDEYARACALGELQPGGLWWWTDPTRGTRVLCFATKGSWRHPSRLDWIASGLDRLAETYDDEGVSSIALPRLGTSHGKLSWDLVRPVVYERLEPCEALRAELWGFDPAAGDPWFDRLVELMDSGDEAALNRLQLSPKMCAALAQAVRSPRVRGLSDLHNARGVGEKTIERVYDFLFGPDGDPTGSKQERLF